MRLVRWLHSRVGLILVLGLLSWGLTGCYTQLQMTGEDPAAETSPEQTARTQGTSFDPAAPLASLRRANPESRAELVSLAKSLQAARADTEISFDEYREGVHFFRTNYPSFYGNYFGDPFYATYDIEYHTTAREAWLAGLDVNPWRDFRSMSSFLCAPHGYDPAFGCRSWMYASSDFFFLPDVFAFSGVAPARHFSRLLRRPFYRSLGYGYSSLGLASHGLFGSPSSYGYGGLYGYGGGLLSTGAGDVFQVNAEERRENRARRGTVGRGGTSAGGGGDADRSREAGTRTDRARYAEGPDRQSSGARGARLGRSADDRDERGRTGRSERGADDGERSEASEMRGDAIRSPQMLIAPVFPGMDDETGALAEVERVTLETVRVSPPSIDGQNPADAIRTYRALQRIAETTDARSVSIQHQDEMSATVRHLQRRRNAYRAGDGTGRHRGANIDRREYGTSRTSGRSSTGREVRSTRNRGDSASGRSRSDRGSQGDSGRDRSRSGSGGSDGNR